MDLKRHVPDYYFDYLHKNNDYIVRFQNVTDNLDSTSLENVIYLGPLLRLEIHS